MNFNSLLGSFSEGSRAEPQLLPIGIAPLTETLNSIEEIATTILRDIRPDRLVY